MILPASTLATLLILVFAMLAWGSWANTQKLAGKWRFELYYYDFTFGFLLLTVLAAFTLGSLNTGELTFQENFLITGYRNMAYALGAGMVFNFGNLFLAATISIAGLSVAFPVALGMALVVSTGLGIATGAQGSVLLSVAGAGLVLAALAITAYAYSGHLDMIAEATKKAGLQLDPRSKTAKRAPRPASAAQAVVLGMISGIALGVYRPVVELARESENGLAPYGLALLFAAGMALTTLVLSPFFFNFPVAGSPVRFRDYFKGTGRQHLLGVFGGLLAGAALLGLFVAASVPATARLAPSVGFALSQSATLLAALWGLLVWHEFKGSSDQTRTLIWGMLLLFAIGIALISLGQT